MAGDDVTITVRADNGDAVRAFRDTEGRLRDMRGRFVSEGSIMSGAMRGLSASIGSLIPAATAAVPAAAALGLVALKTAGAAAGAGVALGAFGAAVAGQVSSLSDASEAQTEYNDAVTQYGVGSKQAAEAQRAAQTTLAGMPAATQRASVALGTLKDTFSDWSDDMAAFTMQPVEKSFTLLGQLIPKLTPMAKGASAQLDRLVSVAGGAIATPGFDAFADRLSVFANEALRDAVNGVIRFAHALSEGTATGPIQSFIEYANANGPALRETLSTVGDAVTTLVQAAAEAGPGMLTLVNAAAGLVAALPPELVATVMQLAVGLKLVTLAGAGAAAISGGIATLGTRIAALQTASTAAGGGMAGLAAAFGTLSRAARASIVVAGIAAVALAVKELSEIGKEAPPDVDKLTTSLAELGRTGKLSGEAARVLGEDFSKLHDTLGKVADPSIAESINNWGADVTNGWLRAGESTEELIEKMGAVDDVLASFVQNGNPELAKAAIARMTEGLNAEQLKEFKDEIDNTDKAFAAAALEAQLTADSMGIFGQAALDTSAKLEAQKGAADGLRQSILALNDVNRSAYDAQIGVEEALDALTESFKEHGATLDLNTEAGQKNGRAMSSLAKAHDEMLSTSIAAGDSLASMTKESESLRAEMMRLATQAFKGNTKAAEEYVNTLLGVPSEITTLVKAEKDQAIIGLQEVRTAIQETPGEKEVTVTTLNAAAIAALEAVGLKTRQLPDGRTAVFTANGQAIGSIGAVDKALNNLDGKTANTYTTHTVTTKYLISGTGETRSRDKLRPGHYAHGGRVRGYATGGDVQAFPDGGFVQGPGTGTSDSILALLGSGAMARISNTEYVVNARQTSKYLPLLEAINRDQLPRFAGGGLTGRRSAGVAGGGGPSVVELRSGGGAAADLVLELLRQAVKPRGGNVQLAVMGRP